MLGRVEVPARTGLVRVSADIVPSWDLSMLIRSQRWSKRGWNPSSVVGRCPGTSSSELQNHIDWSGEAAVFAKEQRPSPLMTSVISEVVFLVTGPASLCHTLSEPVPRAQRI